MTMNENVHWRMNVITFWLTLYIPMDLNGILKRCKTSNDDHQIYWMRSSKMNIITWTVHMRSIPTRKNVNLKTKLHRKVAKISNNLRLFLLYQFNRKQTQESEAFDPVFEKSIQHLHLSSISMMRKINCVFVLIYQQLLQFLIKQSVQWNPFNWAKPRIL